MQGGNLRTAARPPFGGRILVALALVGVVVAGATTPAPRARATSATTTSQPNIVFILTDDQRVGTLPAMPNVERDLVQHGIVFRNAFVTNSECCPSRTSILTGRYSHSTDIWRNFPPDGGFQTFTQLGEDQSTIATWLQSAGYTTALIGKYLNGYNTDLGYVPPGWNKWFAIEAQLYYGYDISNQGHVIHYGNAPQAYSTNVLGSQAVSFIRNTQGPLFLYFAPVAPHSPAIPASRDKNTFGNLQPFRPPNYAEKDVSDKPPYIRAMHWTTGLRNSTDAFRRHQYQSLQAVDRWVNAIVQALAQTGRLSNTAIFFMSDNGILWGEHRWAWKTVPYEGSIRVPLILRYDPLHLSGADTHMVLNVDIAPTIADLAGIPPQPVDGLDMIPLITGQSSTWRTEFPLEHLQESPAGQGNAPTFCGVRTETYVYVRYIGGFEEVYDLTKDPFELTNIASRDPDLTAMLRAHAQALCNPPPPGYSW